jgi:hypothetical protein
MGVPPSSMVGRHETATFATHTLRVSLEVNLSFCLLWGLLCGLLRS